MFTAKNLPLAPVLNRFGARGIQTFGPLDSQINVLKNGKTVVAQGSGGRASRTGYTVTVFGAPGALGTAITTKLAKHGTITVCPYRDEYFKRHLKPTGDLGVVSFKEFDLRNIESLETAVKHSDVVINCIGRDWETKNFTFEDVHIEGARRVAAAAAKFNIPRLIHVSSHSVSETSPSKYFQSKFLGEKAVLKEFPEATIVRPGPMYNSSYNNWLQKMAESRITFTASGGSEAAYPTSTIDVARAIEKMVYDDSTAGKLYELNGTEEWSMRQLFDTCKQQVKRDFHFVQIPKPFLKLWATFLQYAAYWQGPLTPDQVERMFVSQSPVISDNALTYADLGITPKELSQQITHLVRHHRNPTFISDSTETDKLRKKEKESWANIVD